MKYSMILLAATLLLIPFFAQAHGERSYFDKRFDRMDANQDGVISQKEYVHAAKRGFIRMDANDDGALSREEMRNYWKEKRERYKKRKRRHHNEDHDKDHD